jgi:hypothetical protein
VGFRPEGTKRRAHFVEGRHVDVHVMGLPARVGLDTGGILGSGRRSEGELMRRILLVLLVLGGLLSVGVGPAVSAPGKLSVHIRPNAAISADGLHAVVTVRVRCPIEPPVLEAFLYVTQEGNESQFAGLNLTCDGRWHRMAVSVDAFEEAPLHAGRANATAFILLCDETTGECIDGQDSRRIFLREA